MSKEEFITLIRDDLALPLDGIDLDADLDHVVAWDSMHVLQLVSAVESKIGRRIPVGRLLTDRSLGAIYNRIVAA